MQGDGEVSDSWGRRGYRKTQVGACQGCPPPPGDATASDSIEVQGRDTYDETFEDSEGGMIRLETLIELKLFNSSFSS